MAPLSTKKDKTSNPPNPIAPVKNSLLSHQLDIKFTDVPNCVKPHCKYFCFFLLSMFVAFTAQATHLRSADLKVERTTQALRYKITLLIYSNTGSGTIPGGGGFIGFGDGTPDQYIGALSVTPRPDLGVNVGVAVFVVEHQYTFHGTYQVRYYEGDRSAGIINIDNAGDVRYMTYITFNTAFMASNHLPVLNIPPVDRACRFNSFTHNPGATDAEGDVLKYKIVIPRDDFGEIASYKSPIDPVFYTNFNEGNETGSGPPTFAIDENTGLITWDAPDRVGEYNIAFEISEWRINPATEAYEMISTTIRDMQIVVTDCGNVRPTLTAPADVCVVAGATLKRTIKGLDHEKALVKMEAVSDVFDFPPGQNPATYDPFPADFRVADPYDSINFTWTTDCNHVRSTPYQVVFRISDKPPHDIALVTLDTWKIKVMAPAPVWNNPELDLSDRHAILKWKSYACQNADKIQVWRRVDHYPYTPGSCDTGIPKTLDFDLIGEVESSDTVFVDTNSGRRLVDGAQYCYRLVAIFNQTTTATSKTSAEFCFDPIQTDAPVITHVSVEKTSEKEGAVRVSWRSPFAINKTQFPEPYQYHIFRADGFSGQENIANVKVVTNDTTFVDEHINTLDSVFNYRIVVYSIPQGEANYLPVDTSGVASTERLSLTPGIKKITLAWRDSVPWSNVALQNPWHVIYRGTDGEMDHALQKYDSIEAGVDSLYYIDDNLQEDVLYHYRVMTRGTYGNPAIALQENFSQTAFSYPVNVLLPCKPVVKAVPPDCDAFLAANNCDQKDFENTIHWHADLAVGCRKDINRYNIYAANGPEGEFVLIGTTTDTLYTDEHLSSFAQCYKITAIDRSGQESEQSEVVCNDNCVHFELPNVFTPNGDGVNDLFSAFYDSIPNQPGVHEVDPTRCPRFVEAVKFYVYNRWGEELYQYQSGKDKPIFINWNGESSRKTKLESGIYFYAVWVTYNTLDPARRNQKYKGWIHLIR
jgi:hypothetical protein